MPCFHKFFGHAAHMAGENGLLPDWEADTLIIGTFNPSNDWVPNNLAHYFYGRPRSKFWLALPVFADHQAINRQDVNAQLHFLQENRIAITDLLVSINDADIDDNQHVSWIKRFLDNDIANFNDLQWNTLRIIEYIAEKQISAVYFTRLGNNMPFGLQVQIIENYCNANEISHSRLHTPAGGIGMPQLNELVNIWYQQGGNNFPFITPDFHPGNQIFINLATLQYLQRNFIDIPILQENLFGQHGTELNVYLGHWNQNFILGIVNRQVNPNQIPRIMMGVNYTAWLGVNHVLGDNLVIFFNNPQYPNSILIQ